MKQFFTLIAVAVLCISASAQTDTSVSVVITKADRKEFDHRMTFAGNYQQISGVTQILGIIFTGVGTGLLVANLKTGREGYALGAYGCFGVGGTLLITSGGFKIAHGSEIRRMRIKYSPGQYSYPESRK